MMRLLFLILTLSFLTAKSQTTNQVVKINNAFEEWNKPSLPGVAVTVVRDGKVVYQKGFGMSVLNKGTLIDSSTEFWIASVAKQFTAFGIYLLEASGELNLKKSVKEYLPELPDVFKAVTIEQLVHHTSGIRDGFVLTALSKKTEEEYTNENVLKYLKLQKDLNFKPGTAHEYNNSGYVLLAQIIERITKTKYPEFMKNRVLNPLDMTHSYVSGKFPSTEKIAQGYHSKDYSNTAGSFEEGHFMGDTYGSTGIITTISDMGKWAKFLQGSRHPVVYSKARARLLETGGLNSGSRIGYAGGLEKFIYKGKVVYEHFGADEGFKANALFFPKQNLSIIGLTNNTTNFGLSDRLYSIADILFNEDLKAQVNNSSDSNLIWEQAYFIADPFPTYRNIKYYSGLARVSDVPGGTETNYYNTNVTFQTREPINRSLLEISREKVIIRDPYNHQNKILHSIQLNSRSDDYRSFIGNYYSGELETGYQITLDHGELYFEFVPGLRFKLNRLNNTYFIFDYYGPNYIEFVANGFSLSREGIHKLRFRKS